MTCIYVDGTCREVVLIKSDRAERPKPAFRMNSSGAEHSSLGIMEGRFRVNLTNPISPNSLSKNPNLFLSVRGVIILVYNYISFWNGNL